jgi:hypothetical protein
LALEVGDLINRDRALVASDTMGMRRNMVALLRARGWSGVTF